MDFTPKVSPKNASFERPGVNLWTVRTESVSPCQETELPAGRRSLEASSCHAARDRYHRVGAVERRGLCEGLLPAAN
eukprot:135563-Hanusia_phi.AAC.8